jgi:hypothetical protein
MRWKGLAMLAVLPALVMGARAIGAQTAGSSTVPGQTPSTATRPVTQRPLSQLPTGAGTLPHTARPATAPINPESPFNTPTDSSANGGAVEEQVPHVSVAQPPAPQAAAWPLQERIAWVARILLVVFGCVGIYIGLSLLRKIDRQTQYAESAAQSAALAAQAALLQAQSLVRAERPWILVTVEPSGRVENRFMVVATNRGRSPARIISAVEKITTEIDQSSLPAEPQYEDAEANQSLNSVILLPGESTGIKTFGRDDVREFCESDDQFRRIERWEEVILLYGRILYEDLVDSGEREPCQTAWCCWYIHGRQNSGMVMAGPPIYNLHT